MSDLAWLRKLTRDDARRAFILSEILGPPVALRRAPPRTHVASANPDEVRALYRKLGLELPR